MYEKRPTRWRDLPRRRDDVFLPLLTPVGAGRAQGRGRRRRRGPSFLPRGTRSAEDRIFATLFDIFRHKRHHAAELPPVKPTVAEITGEPGEPHVLLPDATTRTTRPAAIEEILDCTESVPELEPLHRLAMVLHNQYPWDLAADAAGARSGEIGDDDFVVRVRAAKPRGARVHPAREGRASGAPAAGTARRGARAGRAAPPDRRPRAVRASCPASSRWRSSRASTSARTRTSSATRPTAGRR